MLKINRDKRGGLISLNNFASLPFVPKRFMYIYNVPDGETRGYHAHKTNCQIFMCMKGKTTLKTITKNGTVEFIRQERSLSEGEHLIMPPMTWGEQTYFDDAVALVLCSKEYDERDYIRDYEQFKKH